MSAFQITELAQYHGICGGTNIDKGLWDYEDCEKKPFLFAVYQPMTSR